MTVKVMLLSRQVFRQALLLAPCDNESMSYDAAPHTFRAHFDGQRIVPDEEVEIPPMARLIVTIEPSQVDPRSIEERLVALNAWAGHLDLPPLPPQAFDRGDLYRDAI